MYGKYQVGGNFMKRRSDFSNMEEYVSYLEVLVDELSVQVQTQVQAISFKDKRIREITNQLSDKEYAIQSLMKQNNVLRIKYMDAYGLSFNKQFA